MGFLAPLALTLAALSIPILILYMLKLRREEQVVSSTMLWQQVLRDRQANAPWQRLRRNLLLLLQLLLLLLLVIALARPYNQISRTAQGNVVVLLDASASMQTTDVSPSRFEAARSITGQLVDSLGPNDTMTLIAVADVPQVLSSLTNDRSVLRQALSAAQVTYTEADWEAAFILAASSAQQAQHTSTVLLSDGGLPPGLPDLPGDVRYIPIGITAENRAITALAIRDASQGPQAFLGVSNMGTQPANPLVEIDVDGTLFDARSLSIPPGDQRTIVLQDLPLDARRIEARLDGPDALQLDDVAWAVRSRDVRASVLLATQGDVYLERAIGLIPHFDPIVVHAEQETLPPGALAQLAPLPALYVLDGVLPDRLPEAGNLLFINPPASTDLFVVCGTLTRTLTSQVAADDPLLRHVDLTDLQVARAHCIETPSWAHALAAAGDRPLLLAGEVGGRRIAILAFDLHHSNLPLQIAFPILIANLANWLAPTSAVDIPALAEGAAALRPGMPVVLRPQVGTDQIAVHAPSGRAWTFPVESSDPIPFAETHELGIYTVEQRGEEKTVQTQFAVNLFSDLESHIGPRDAVAVGTSQLQPQADLIGQREWWRWAALAALLVLIAEWIVYWQVRSPPVHAKTSRN